MNSWPMPLLYGGILLPCGVVLLAMVFRDRHLLAYGQYVPGFITNWGQAGRSSATYVASYEFRLPDGTRLTGTYYVGNQQPTSGAVICVLYLPERPRRNARYPLSLAQISTS